MIMGNRELSCHHVKVFVSYLVFLQFIIHGGNGKHVIDKQP